MTGTRADRIRQGGGVGPTRRTFTRMALAAAAATAIPGPLAVAREDLPAVLALRRLGERLRADGQYSLGAGSFRLEGRRGLRIEGGSYSLTGAGSGKTSLDASALRESDAPFEIGPRAGFRLSGLTVTGCEGPVVHVPTRNGGTDEPQAAPDEADAAAALTLEDVVFSRVGAPVSMTNEGNGNAAIGGIAAISITNCKVSDADRGFMLGDAGSYLIRTVDISDVSIERSGRFGLFVGGTREAGTAVTEHIRISGFTSRDLGYVKGTNCAHLYVAGRNVVLKDIDLQGAVYDAETAGQSDKEGLYLKCRNAELSDIRIVDTLADQGALVLKGEAFGSSRPAPEGGDYRVRDLTVVQSTADQPPMRGVWLQTGPASISGASFDGLGRQAITVNGPAFDGIRLEGVTVRNHRWRTAISAGSHSLRNLTISGCTIGPAEGSGRFEAIAFFPPRKGGEMEAITISDCHLGGGATAGGRQAGIAFGLTPAARFGDVMVERCVFDCDQGIAFTGLAAGAEIAISDCDFTALADPTLAIAFALRGKAREAGGSSPLVVFSGTNEGIVLAHEGRIVIPPQKDGIEIALPLTLFRGFDAGLEPDEVTITSKAGANAVVLETARADRLKLRRADTGYQRPLEIAFKVSKLRWRGTDAG